MKSLTQQLRKNGFCYTQIQREGVVCLYSQEVGPNLQYFEVFLVKVKQSTIFKGKHIPEREIFPSDEAFGRTAWSCRTLEEATSKFNEMIKNKLNY